MKLSWLSTSEAHKQTKHVYDMTIWINAQCKRERVRESGSNTNTEICFEVRVHSSTSPPSHRRISTNLFTQDFPHRETSNEDLGQYNNREYTTPLSTEYNLSQRLGTKPHKHHLTQRGRHLANTNQSPHTWGIPTQTLPLTEEANQQSPPLTRGS